MTLAKALSRVLIATLVFSVIAGLLLFGHYTGPGWAFFGLAVSGWVVFVAAIVVDVVTTIMRGPNAVESGQ